MTRLCFLTLEDRADFVIDDELAIAELARRGIAVEEVPWRRAGDASGYDAVVIRTPWDYQRDLPAFLATLDAIAAAGVPLANDPTLVRWNADKRYLGELAARGVPIVPTTYGVGLTVDELRGMPGRLGVGECVVKPVVGANADDTYRVTAESASQEVVSRYVDRAWMAQPFVEAVVSEGEHSLFFFDGELSHAIVKIPRRGDFRVQEEHGGEILAEEATAELVAAATGVMAALGDPPLQARVDLVRLADGSLALMELEAIEPSLYFRMHPRAPAHFADAIERWLARR